MIHMEYYLVVSTIMMFAGIYGFFTRRNTLAILISVELMLNATDINFAVFNRFLFPGGMEGYFFALFSIAISAAETAIAIAIMIIHLPTGKKFHNRKEAKIYFGTAYYYKMEREKKYLVFTNNVQSATNEYEDTIKVLAKQDK